MTLWNPINPCRPCPSLSFLVSSSPLSNPFSNSTNSNHCTRKAAPPFSIISASIDSGELTARGRRQLRNERRESRATNWREEVEQRLMKKPKKKYASWTEELNLDNLALLGPQWWVIRVSRTSTQSTADQLARALARNFPGIDFKVYIPAVRFKRKLKNGSYSDKTNPLFPGCIFLHCVLNREIHDFVRECIGVGGFLGSKVGNTKRQINRPKPVSSDDMEAIFKQAKEEQEKSDRAFEEEQRAVGIFNDEELNISTYSASGEVTTSTKVARPKRQSKKISEPSDSNLLAGENHKFLSPDSSVRVLSGPFAEFIGCLKELDQKSGKATVELLLFGKESLVDLDIDQIAAESM
ncbi:hypothetical protein AAC387_Pa01g1313 [Persea americana]